MKYSIRGTLAIEDESLVIGILNHYTLWKLDPRRDELNYTFEAWVNTKGEQESLFEELKPLVDTYGELIDWHECTHDEPTSQPCDIIETYKGVI